MKHVVFRYYFVVAHELKIKVESFIDLTKGAMPIDERIF